MPSSIVRFGKASSVGGSLTEVTTRLNEVLVVFPSASRTVRVRVVIPDAFGAGITVTSRLLPTPLKTIFVGGTRNGLEERPDMTRLEAGVSASVMVKACDARGASSDVVTFGIAEMVGPSA